MNILTRFNKNNTGFQYLRIVAVGILYFLLVTGCADIRKLTYPSEFVYLDKTTIAGAMHEMAVSLNHMDNLVRGAGSNGNFRDSELQEQVLAELDSLESVADNLNTRDNSQGLSRDRQKTNHLLIDENIELFLKDIATAKLQVQANPPNYFMVGRLSGGCNACHTQ